MKPNANYAGKSQHLSCESFTNEQQIFHRRSVTVEWEGLKKVRMYSNVQTIRQRMNSVIFIIGTYGRLDENGHFKTIRTTVYPTKKSAKVLHPTVCCQSYHEIILMYI